MSPPSYQSLVGWLRLSRNFRQTKRFQHFNTTYRNIVGRNILRAFGHPVAACRMSVLFAHVFPVHDFSLWIL